MPQYSYHILVFRFSSFGDIAMTVPVIQEFLEQNPGIKITYVSRKKFEPLFAGIQNLTFFPADFEGKHKGFGGLYRLYKDLKHYNFNAIADLHNVLRTKILVQFFNSKVEKTAVLDKARNDRKALLNSKIKKPLKPMTERYADVFRKLGFEFKLSHRLKLKNSKKENAVGIAPFAMYKGKMYPLEKMIIVAKSIAEKGINVYLFGGKEESAELKKWEKLNSNIHSVAGKLDLKEELDLIQNLKLMVSMDSANMHLASLAGTKVISIWGNTHPFMGFLGYGQSMENVIQDETMTERPTSVFGKEKRNAPKTDYFQNISAELIIDKITSEFN